MVAWGARAVLAAALEHTPWLAVHHDLLAQPTRAVVKAATRYAKGVVSVSEAIARQFGGDVLHPGVDLTAFTPTPLPPGPPRALVLGALVDWKRPQLAIEIAARMPELHVTIAGAPLPGEQGPRLAATERVTLAGPVADVRQALADHHVLLHCADAEPYGMVLVEALAAGRPVVAPANAGPLEIVQDGAGRLYRPGDAAAAVAGAARRDPERPRGARAPPAAAPSRPSTSATPSPGWRPRSREPSPPSSSCTARATELARLLPTLHADAADRRRRRPRRRRRATSPAEHGAEVIVRRDNPGFGAANNLALERVTQPVTVLVNPDVIVHGDALERLAQRTRTARACTPRACSTPTAASSAARTRSPGRSAPSSPP